MNSTSTPVSAVNFLATVSEIRSFQLPPQLETISLSAAPAGDTTSVAASAATAINIRFMVKTPGSLVHSAENSMSSLLRDARFLDHFGPAGRVRRDDVRQFLGRAS